VNGFHHRNNHQEQSGRQGQHQQHQYKYFSTSLTSMPYHPISSVPSSHENNHRDFNNQYQQQYPHWLLLSQQQQPQIQHRRSFHTTPTSERAVAIMLGLATVSALAYAGSSAVRSYQEWKVAQPTPEELEEMRQQQEQEKEGEKTNAQNQTPESDQDTDRPREDNIFRQWFDVGTKYYDGMLLILVVVVVVVEIEYGTIDVTPPDGEKGTTLVLLDAVPD
jgi:hypothetical protein